MVSNTSMSGVIFTKDRDNGSNYTQLIMTIIWTDTW